MTLKEVILQQLEFNRTRLRECREELETATDPGDVEDLTSLINSYMYAVEQAEEALEDADE